MSVVIKGSEPFDVMIASNIVNCQTANIKFKNISFKCETIEDASGTIFVKMPSAQPEPKEGEWVQIQRCARDAQPDLECPFCKHRIGWFDMGRYCAGCGAKLKGGAG